MTEKNRRIIEQLKNGLILSCQVKKTDPLYLPGIIEKLVECGEWGDTCGYRIDTPENIAKVRAITNKPIIGLWKINMETEDVFITPTMKEVDEIVKAGAHMVAPTLYRFNENPKSTDSPVFEELARIVEYCKDLGIVIMEGKIYTPEDAIKSLYLGAHAVVVGNAVTRPHITTLRFTSLMNKLQRKIPLKY